MIDLSTSARRLLLGAIALAALVAVALPTQQASASDAEEMRLRRQEIRLLERQVRALESLAETLERLHVSPSSGGCP